jgi:hypothetical protein
MNKLALVLPGNFLISDPQNNGALNNFLTGPGRISYLVSQFLQVALYIGGTVMIFWMGWGVFQYIFAGGNKERLAFARKRIIFAILGFLILMMAYSIQLYVRQAIFVPQLNDNSIKNITSPSP